MPSQRHGQGVDPSRSREKDGATCDTHTVLDASEHRSGASSKSAEERSARLFLINQLWVTGSLAVALLSMFLSNYLSSIYESINQLCSIYLCINIGIYLISMSLRVSISRYQKYRPLLPVPFHRVQLSPDQCFCPTIRVVKTGNKQAESPYCLVNIHGAVPIEVKAFLAAAWPPCSTWVTWVASSWLRECVIVRI